MNQIDAELTMDERNALCTEVFPSLCRPSWFLRIFKLVIPVFILVISCTTANVQTSSFGTTPLESADLRSKLSEKISASADPAEFVSQFPENDIILNSVVMYEKKPAEALIANEAEDFGYSNGLFAFLKGDRLFLSSDNCPSMLTEDGYSSLTVAGNLLQTKGKEGFAVYDAEACAEIYQKKKLLPIV
ncbi:hypothetical protein [Limisalsivibrio acetivorans]|uniref:hypothetical protein n=1 Tax=Limisalsivibrio acetivorans TaxID=1304888 RepID=UPI0012DCAD88|nr:hypothetical protein [Limisalsivibrio acetivorans]